MAAAVEEPLHIAALVHGSISPGKKTALILWEQGLPGSRVLQTISEPNS